MFSIILIIVLCTFKYIRTNESHVGQGLSVTGNSPLLNNRVGDL